MSTVQRGSIDNVRRATVIEESSAWMNWSRIPPKPFKSWPRSHKITNLVWKGTQMISPSFPWHRVWVCDVPQGQLTAKGEVLGPGTGHSRGAWVLVIRTLTHPKAAYRLCQKRHRGTSYQGSNLSQSPRITRDQTDLFADRTTSRRKHLMTVLQPVTSNSRTSKTLLGLLNRLFIPMSYRQDLRHHRTT